jgi:CheY-like chemotaxis protein
MDTYKILIVDDELLIRDLLYDYFLSKDYSIMTANSAEEAMEIVEQHDDFDVVLTDIKTGYSLLKTSDKATEICPSSL